MTALFKARNVTKSFATGLGQKSSPAIQDFSLTIEDQPPSIIALVGESGSGKTTLARLLLGLAAPTSGEILYRGKRLQSLGASDRRQFRRDVQIIFQDPFEVYNPFYKVDHLLTVPIAKFGLASSRKDRARMMAKVLADVGLDPDEILGRYPHQLSGGQRQRVAIARALLIQPRLIIADEPVSMVDASLRASILANLYQLHRDFGISILYITHDLATAFQIAEHMIVLYRGSVVETGDVELIVQSPRHPYTQLLIDSIPQPDPDHPWGGRQDGTPPVQHGGSGTGCKFADRCPRVMPACLQAQPPLFQTDPHRAVACLLYHDAPVLDNAQMDSVLSVKPVAETGMESHDQGEKNG
jgi:oligopeptide/dipeptide ABC transporter ATP-binding protein